MSKGGGYEIKICRKLTEWVTGKQKPEIFWRSGGSGAQATAAYKRGDPSHMGGDIMAVDKDGVFFTLLFSVEAKNRKSFSLNLSHLIKGTKAGDKHTSSAFSWWEKTVVDAERWDKTPLFIFKSNFTPDFIMYPPVVRSMMVDWFGAEPDTRLVYGGVGSIVLLDSFLELVDPKVLRDNTEEIRKCLKVSS